MRWPWTLTGAALGVSAVPGSFGLYAFYFVVPVLGPVLGIPGLILLQLHIVPMEWPLEYLGLMDLHTPQPLTGVRSIAIVFFAAVVWGPLYCLAGFGLDVLLRKKRGDG